MPLALGTLVVTLACIVLMVIHTVITGISPVPTSPEVLETLMTLLPEDVSGEIFELGSGWGNLAFRLARRYMDGWVEAYELSVVPFAFCWLWHLVRPARNLKLHRADFFDTSLERARLVVCYLHPPAMHRLAPKLEAELPSGAVVACNYFPVPGWRPLVQARARDQYESPVYVYRVPESLPRARHETGAPGDRRGREDSIPPPFAPPPGFAGM